MVHLLFALLILGTTAGSGVAGAHLATPAPRALPHEHAPFGLDRLTLPATVGEVESVFATLPSEVAGLSQSGWIEHPDRTQVAYGDDLPAIGFPLEILVISFDEGDFCPGDFTAGDYVAMTLATDDAGAVAGGRDGEMAWVRAEIAVGIGDRQGTPEVIGTRYTLTWGEIGSGFMIAASADSPEGLEAIVSAFVVAAGEHGAPGATPAE